MPKVDVHFYDDAHKALLKSRLSKTSFDAMEKLVQEGLTFAPEEFSIHTVFRDQKNLGLKTYKDVAAAAGDFRGALGRYYDWGGDSIYPAADVRTMPQDMAEKLGVGASLMAANRVFDLHEADWQGIDDSNFKDLDFEIAATTDMFVEVESKGAWVDDPKARTHLSTKKTDIESKKRVQRIQKGNRNCLIGVITAVAKNRNKPAQCYLLDPEPRPVSMEPRRYKLISRIGFYMNALNVISGAHFLYALRDRYELLRQIPDYEQLDGIRIAKPDGEPWTFTVESFPGKTVLGEEEIVGRLIRAGDGLIFWGLSISVLNTLSSQSFDAISRFAVQPGYARRRNFRGIVHGRDVRALRLPDDFVTPAPWPNLLYLTVEGSLYMGRSGIVVGRVRPVGGNPRAIREREF